MSGGYASISLQRIQSAGRHLTEVGVAGARTLRRCTTAWSWTLVAYRQLDRLNWPINGAFLLRGKFSLRRITKRLGAHCVLELLLLCCPDAHDKRQPVASAAQHRSWFTNSTPSVLWFTVIFRTFSALAASTANRRNTSLQATQQIAGFSDQSSKDAAQLAKGLSSCACFMMWSGCLWVSLASLCEGG